MAEKATDNVDCRLIVVDSAENFQSIKQKIATAYSAFKADFLLLIGDFEHIPAYLIEEGLSDMQYGILSDDDSEPVMVVGRFSVETAEHLQTMISRSLTYKNCSKTVVGIASKERSDLTQLTDFEQVATMDSFLTNKGFAIEAELFENIETSPTPQDVINILNQGITWVNYAGNGSYYGWNTSGFSNQHIDSLKNSEELPIILSAACLNGYFAQRECFAEKWMRASANGRPTGARAVIMSSIFADWDATLSGMLLMCENLPSQENNCRLGTLYKDAYLHISNELMRKKEAKCWLLFGDPSLWIYPPDQTKTKEPHLPAQANFLYPNPTNGKLQVTSYELQENSVVEIYDIVGQLLYQINKSTNNQINNEISIDVSHLEKGIYFLKIDNKVVRFVKE